MFSWMESQTRQRREEGGGRRCRCHSRSYQWDGVREVALKERDDLVPRGDLLKLLKGHEERAGERLVLEHQANTKCQSPDPLPQWIAG